MTRFGGEARSCHCRSAVDICSSPGMAGARCRRARRPRLTRQGKAAGAVSGTPGSVATSSKGASRTHRLPSRACRHCACRYLRLLGRVAPEAPKHSARLLATVRARSDLPSRVSERQSLGSSWPDAGIGKHEINGSRIGSSEQRPTWKNRARIGESCQQLSAIRALCRQVARWARSASSMGAAAA
jgi:hypothetical protein